MNFSINIGEFRVVLAPPIAKAVAELEGSASVVGRDKREIVRFLDAKMPWWREVVVLVEELFDRKKDVWREITFEYRTTKRPNAEVTGSPASSVSPRGLPGSADAGQEKWTP